MQRNHRGFTLVEIIIVISIIAVLAAVLAPQYIRYVEQARQSVCLQTLGTLNRLVRHEEIAGEWETMSEAKDALVSEGILVEEQMRDACPSHGTVTWRATGYQCTLHGIGATEFLFSPAPEDRGKTAQELMDALNESEYGKNYLTSTSNTLRRVKTDKLTALSDGERSALTDLLASLTINERVFADATGKTVSVLYVSTQGGATSYTYYFNEQREPVHFTLAQYKTYKASSSAPSTTEQWTIGNDPALAAAIAATAAS